MSALETFVSTVVWPNAMLAIPLFLAVAALNRWLPSRPSTRHALWAVALLLLLVPTTIIGLAGRPAAESLHRLAASAVTPSDTPDGAELSRDAIAVPPVKPPAAPHPEAPIEPSLHPDVAPAPSTPSPSFTRPSDAWPRTVEASSHPLPDVSIESGPAPTPPRIAESPTMIPSAARRTLSSPLSSPPPSSPSLSRLTIDAEPRLIPTPELTINLAPPLATTPPVAPVAPPAPSGDAADRVGDAAVASVVTHAGPTWTSEWTARVGAARDAIVAIPPLPAVIWISGVAALVLVGLVRLAHVVRLARSASPASESVERMVWSVAEELGVPSAPLVRMTPRPVTPMVLCLGRPTLLLPQGLWSQLDDAGRRAVVTHEVAHLRRRDHWMSWLDLVVGVIYWWHPGVWWARRQLCEQADASCDAWVVALRPESRRAYAEALLAARSQSSQDYFAAPAVGLGVTTRRTKRFARRLTMVMTEQKAPGRSLSGAGLASVLSFGALFAAPMFACPESDCQTGATAKTAVVAESGDAIDAGALEALALLGQNAIFESQPQPDDWRRRDRDEMRQRDRRDDLEARVDRMEAMLEEILARMEGREHPRGHGDAPAREMRERELIEDQLRRAREMQEQAAMERDRPRRGAAGPSAEIVERVYEISGGKKKQLLNLMLRDDVPIRVAEQPNGILVQATPDQHMIMEAFVLIIGSDKQQDRDYRMSRGKLDALTELMIRDDVPVLVRPHDDRITVLGPPIEQAIFGAFVEMIEPGDRPTRDRRAGMRAPGPDNDIEMLQHEIEMLEQQGRIHEELLVDAEHELDDIRREIEMIERQLHEHDDDRELHQVMEELHRAHEMLMRQLDERRGALEGLMHRRAELIAQRERMIRRGGR